MDKIIAAIIKFFTELLKTKTPVPAPVAVPPAKKVWNRATFKEYMNLAIGAYAHVRETEGQNRSKEIDMFNKLADVDIGSPYCVSGAVFGLYPYIIKLAKADGIHLQYAGPSTASSQSFFKRGAKAVIGGPVFGAAAIYQQLANPTRGHFTTCLVDKLNGKKFDTFEFNTSVDIEKNGEMERDGQGASFKTRSIEGYTSMRFLGFVDVYQFFVVDNG